MYKSKHFGCTAINAYSSAFSSINLNIKYIHCRTMKNSRNCQYYMMKFMIYIYMLHFYRFLSIENLVRYFELF